VPLRVFSRTYYPSLVSLYQLLGVEIVDADYSFSCSRFTRGKTNTGSVGNKEEGEEEDEPLFGYNRYGPLVLPQLGAYWQLPSWLRNKAAANQPTRAWRDTNLGLMLQLLRLLLRCNAYLDAGGGMVGLSNVSLGDFLASKGYSPKFCAELFYPMLSVVCTCTYEAVAAYPAGMASRLMNRLPTFFFFLKSRCLCIFSFFRLGCVVICEEARSGTTTNSGRSRCAYPFPYLFFSAAVLLLFFAIFFLKVSPSVTSQRTA